MFRHLLIPLAITVAFTGTPCKSAVDPNIAQFKNNVSDTLKLTHKLQKTIKGIVYTMADSNYAAAAVGMPNQWGSVVKVGIPTPTGVVPYPSYTRPARGVVNFLANEIHKRVNALIAEQISLPVGWREDKSLEASFANIEKDIYDIEARDRYIQDLVHSTMYGRNGDFLFGKEVLAMSKDADDLNAALKSTKKEIDNTHISPGTANIAINENTTWK